MKYIKTCGCVWPYGSTSLSCGASFTELFNMTLSAWLYKMATSKWETPVSSHWNLMWFLYWLLTRSCHYANTAKKSETVPKTIWRLSRCLFAKVAEIHIAKSILLTKVLLENKLCLRFVACPRNLSSERDRVLQM